MLSPPAHVAPDVGGLIFGAGHVKLRIDSNIDKVLGETARLHPQWLFAVAKAMSDTVVEIAKGLPDEANRSFEGGATRFTKQGFEYERATKEKLEAAVAVRPLQAQYLYFQVEGGRRPPRRIAQRLPSVVDLDPQGNIPRGLIRQLIARAKAGKRVTRAQSRKFKVSQEVDLFYGEPGDGRPAGIYKRVVLSATRHQLVPIVVFPKVDAVYRRKPFDFYGYSAKRALATFEANLDRAWSLALATAR